MFRIRRIFDTVAPANESAIEQVRTILASQFALLDEQKIARLNEQLLKPLGYGVRTILYVAEDHRAKVGGFALIEHDPRLAIFYLDYLASDKALEGRGVGAALYDRVRSEALTLGSKGVFFECLPDVPELCKSPLILESNKSRLRFYERYGARPIIGTAYETPVKPDGDNPPYLVFDDLGLDTVLSRKWVKDVVASILERKYADLCGPEYNKLVLDSIRDDPVRLRPPRYASKPATEVRQDAVAAGLSKIALVVTDQHAIHHVHERGYVESPVRLRAILKSLEATSLFETVKPRPFPDSWITTVHDPEYVKYFKLACKNADPGAALYPYVFPIRNRARPPVELPVRAGYYCIDTFTPISGHAYVAARRAVDCALSAAEELVAGRHIAYTLVRPPGHHAERGVFGGFCYFNNGAIAAHSLSRYGRVAMLDIDYHHGNGQQEIFYSRADVLTISIHGHPKFAYPYFTGFADEEGEGAGAGFNLNIPLPEKLAQGEYLRALRRALKRIDEFAPTYLVICLGLDTAQGDPTGTWGHRAVDFNVIGGEIGGLRLPVLVMQEGGYKTRSLGSNARAFFEGLFAKHEPASSVKPGRVH